MNSREEGGRERENEFVCATSVVQHASRCIASHRIESPTLPYPTLPSSIELALTLLLPLPIGDEPRCQPLQAQRLDDDALGLHRVLDRFHQGDRVQQSVGSREPSHVDVDGIEPDGALVGGNLSLTVVFLLQPQQARRLPGIARSEKDARIFLLGLPDDLAAHVDSHDVVEFLVQQDGGGSKVAPHLQNERARRILCVAVAAVAVVVVVGIRVGRLEVGLLEERPDARNRLAVVVHPDRGHDPTEAIVVGLVGIQPGHGVGQLRGDRIESERFH
mmetsp:Transcript_2898/g.7889  ORF Transcript_2898/g.7889 Transcript_2898/m.7889 type:complete len:274 (+) Transcript_2898:887-1708(+)